MQQLGKLAFIAGFVLAVLAGFMTLSWFWWVLAVLGLIVGFLNVGGDETRGFLLAAIGLILSAASVQQLPYIGDQLTNILANVVVFIAPAVLVVSLKSLFETAKN